MEIYSHSNALVSAVLNHRSTPAALLDEPAPAGDDFDTIIQSAVSAPDHGKVMPWRFICIEGEARNTLGDVFVQAKTEDDPNFTEEQASTLRKKPLRAPMIVAVVADITENHPKAPWVEQVLCAGAAAQHMQITARALGFGSIWLTGPMARHATVKTALGLKPADELVGFLYLGTPSTPAPARRRVDSKLYVENWNGA